MISSYRRLLRRLAPRKRPTVLNPRRSYTRLAALVVLVHFHLDAMKISKEKAILANQSRGLRAEAFSARLASPIPTNMVAT